MAETHQFDVKRLFGVDGYVCLVTGGGTGIGLMAAQALAANGAKVYITGRRMEALENAAKNHHPDERGGEIIPIGPCDVRSKDSLQKLVEEFSKKEKYLNLLVCNAGVAGPKATPEHEDADQLKQRLWENESVEDWQATFETDVTSVYFTTVAFLTLLQAAMKPKGGPFPEFSSSIITISSMSGIMRHAQGHFSYNAAKGATVHLSKLMSAEFMKASIRLNSIAPGYFPSEMTAKSSDDRQKSDLPQEKIDKTGHVPMKRGGTDEEMGMTVLYLAKNMYVNGEIIAVDGGVLNVVSGR